MVTDEFHLGLMTTSNNFLYQVSSSSVINNDLVKARKRVVCFSLKEKGGGPSAVTLAPSTR